MAENKQTHGWNQWVRNKENNVNNQWNQEFLIWENQQERQTLIGVNKAHRKNIQIDKIWNENDDMTTFTKTVQRIIRPFFKYLNSIKLKIKSKKVIFLVGIIYQSYVKIKFKKKKKNLRRPISPMEVETVI